MTLTFTFTLTLTLTGESSKILKILHDFQNPAGLYQSMQHSAGANKAERHRRSALLFYSRVTTGMTMGLRLVFLNR